MPFVDGRTIPEVLMRPGIHGRFLAHKDLGANTVSLLMNRADPGAAVPLHVHQVEETAVMLEGRIWVQLGDERRIIGPNDTVIIPAFVPHAWGTEGTEAARIMWVVWRSRSLCRFHVPRRRTTQAARLAPPMTYPSLWIEKKNTPGIVERPRLEARKKRLTK